MPKRGAEHQLTKDGGEEGSDEEQQSGNASAPVEGRVIRGMPKRKGLGGAPAAPASTPAAPQAPASASAPFSFGNAPSSTGSFSFGPTKPASPPSTFSFGGAPKPAAETCAAVPEAPKAFSGFSFGGAATSKPAPPKPATTASNNPFSFGSSSGAATPAPAANLKPVSTSSAAPFSFGSSSSAAAPSSATTTATPAFGSNSSFSFGSKPSPFAGGAATPTLPQSEPEPEKKAAPAPFSGFSFGAAPAKPAVPPVPAAQPAEKPAPAPTPAPSVSLASSTPEVSQTNGNAVGKTSVPSGEVDEKEVAYLIQLRGLNASFVTFLTNQVEADSLTDFSSALNALAEQYGEKIKEIAKKTGYKRSETAKPVPAKAPAIMSKPPVAPPIVGSFKLLAPSTSSSSTPPSGGFVPTLPAAPSGGFSFGFGAKPVEKKETETSKLVGDLIANGANGEVAAKEQKSDVAQPWQIPALFKSASTESAASDVTEMAEESPAPPAPTPVISTPSKTGGMFSFGPSNPSASTSAATPPRTFSTTPTAPAARLGMFGPGGSTPSLSFGAASPSTAAKSGFSFGAAPAAVASGSKSSFSFGSSASKSTTSASEAPVKTSGFSFGSSGSTAPATASEKPAFSFGAASSSTGSKPAPFSFGTPATNAPSTGDSPVGTSTPADDSQPEEIGTPDGEAAKNLAATVGAGEENEETIAEQRSKVYQLKDGKQVAMGLVILKLKRSKDEGKSKSRILARIDPGGQIVLNFGINASMKPTVKGKQVAFIGFDQDGKPANYTLLVKTSEMASTLGDALRKEAEAIAARQ